MMKFRYLFTLSLLASLLFFATSCSQSDEPDLTGIADRTVLVYMSANNSLGNNNCDLLDLIEMRNAAVSGGIGRNNRLMVFHGSKSGSQTLFEIKNDGSKDTVRVYDGNEFAVSADFMLEVFETTKQVAPANDYGLVLWSHSLGWLQNGLDDEGPGASVKTWGEDRGRTMNITTLKRVLEASPWSWIYFDCCFMGSVEVAYELAPVVKTIVASATEIPLDGMPYDKNIPLFFKSTPNLEQAALNTFEYYNALSGENRTATISVLDLSAIASLASATREIYRQSSIVAPNDFYNLPLEIRSSPRFYDFGVYVEGLCSMNNLGQDLYNRWRDAHDKVVVFFRTTPKLWDVIDLSRFTGLSTYIPASAVQQNLYGYNTLSWYDEVARWLYNK